MVSLSDQTVLSVAVGIDKPDYSPWNPIPLYHVPEKLEYLVQGLLVKDQPTIVAATGKSCKTTLLLDLAVSMASGGKFMDRWQCTKGRVLYLAGDRLVDPKEAANAITDRRGLELNLNDICTDRARIFTSENVKQLSRMLRNECYTAVIVDMLKDVGGEDPNKPDCTRLLNNLRDACLDAHCMPIVACHSTKGQGGNGLALVQGTEPQKWAGNWLVIKRQVEYAHDHTHYLTMEYGARGSDSGVLDLFLHDQTYEITWGAKAKRKANRDYNKEVHGWFTEHPGEWRVASDLAKKLCAGSAQVQQAMESLHELGKLEMTTRKNAGKSTKRYALA